MISELIFWYGVAVVLGSGMFLLAVNTPDDDELDAEAQHHTP